MPFCSKCGAEVLSSHRYCRGCGTALLHATDSQTAPVMTGATAQTLPYQISLTRVLILGVLSYNLYLYYWFYLTWKQYRDHTGAEAYPSWHALTLFIPIYSLFRTHAHVRAFKELMLNASLSTNLNAVGAVALVLLLWITNTIGVTYIWGTGGLSGPLTRGDAVVSAVTGLISVAVSTGLIIHVQENLNRYWASLENAKAGRANIGIAEVLLVLLGLLFWSQTLANLVSPAV